MASTAVLFTACRLFIHSVCSSGPPADLEGPSSPVSPPAATRTRLPATIAWTDFLKPFARAASAPASLERGKGLGLRLGLGLGLGLALLTL